MQQSEAAPLSYHRALLRCRLCLGVAVAIFVCILVVEALIFLPSYVREGDRLRDTLDARALTYAHAVIKSGAMVSEGDALRRAAPPEVTALRITGPDGEPVASFGAVTAPMVPAPWWLPPSLGYPVSPFTVATEKGAYAVQMVLDLSGARAALGAFSLRIAGLVLMIAASATAVAMLAAGYLLMSPLLVIRRSLEDAASRPEGTRFDPVPGRQYGEMRSMASSVNRLLDQIAEHNNAQRRRIETTDLLTGALNRRGLLEAVPARGLDRSDFGVAVVDLEDFARLYDIAGTPEGDRLLRRAARALQGVAGTDAILARLSGHVFAVASARFLHPDAASGFANRLLRAVDEAAAAEIQGRAASASCGVALSREHSRVPEDLLRGATLAAGRARTEGGGRVRFSDARHDALAKRYRKLERALRGAVSRDELHLVYQPKVDLRGGGLCGAEALVRWRMRGEEDVSPGEFIPIAEAAGLVSEIGQWVTAQTIRDAAAWRAAGLQPPRLAVNLSAAQLGDFAYAEFLADALASAGLPGNVLEVEVTESAFIADIDQAIRVLDRLADIGVRATIDDFGTGYSSLSYLRRLPVRAVKIDRAFVDSLGEDANARLIAEAIVSLGRTLKLETVAEGIETEEQAAFLRGIGCDLAQGFLYGRPVAAEDFARQLDRPPLAAVP